MKTMEVKSVTKKYDTAIDLGLSDKQNLDYKNIRGETSEATQRPKHTTTPMKSDKGTFTQKG